ncbi:hypothetical protein JW898_01050 [Candidatus Woesearchaeota archaeon]|nr:hypothetical protein [Candidatus Woesearchaeota archaeon]
MGVVRIDDMLEKQVEELIKKDENRYKYPSKTAFLNMIIHERLLELENLRTKRGQGKKR